MLYVHCLCLNVDTEPSNFLDKNSLGPRPDITEAVHTIVGYCVNTKYSTEDQLSPFILHCFICDIVRVILPSITEAKSISTEANEGTAV